MWPFAEARVAQVQSPWCPVGFCPWELTRLREAAQTPGAAVSPEPCSLCRRYCLKTNIPRSLWGNLPKTTVGKTVSNLSDSEIFWSDLNWDTRERSFLWLTMAGFYIIYNRKLHPLFQCTCKQSSSCCYLQLMGLTFQQYFNPKSSKQIFNHTAIIRKIVLLEKFNV